MQRPQNLFEGVPPKATEEIFTELLSHSAVRIERIVSTGQVTPPDAPYCQPHDEWVLLLVGSARLWIEGAGECTLRPGGHLMVPAGRAHRVTFTATDQPTIWLAVHFPAPASAARLVDDAGRDEAAVDRQDLPGDVG
jgi:cupin 2 domain-containing protein